MAENTAVTAELKTQSVKEFMTENNLTQIGGKMVRATKDTGYPFVTFISSDNVAQNIYFSKGASELTAVGEEIGRGFFDKFQIVYAHNNAANAILPKLGRLGGDGTRTNIEDLF